MNDHASGSRSAAQVSMGVDIGSHAAKIAFLGQVGRRLELREAEMIELPPGSVVGGVVQNPRAIGRLIAGELDVSEYKSIPTVTSIPSHIASLRWVQLPLLTPDELREAARYKVKRHLPYSVDDAYVEASIPVVEPGESAGESLVIAVPKRAVESRAETIEAAGLNPVGAELEAQAILRVVERRLSEESVLWRDASLTIIDVGGTNTHMYVVQNQRLQFIRGVRFGGDLISSAVAEALEISRREADVVLNHPESRLMPNGTLVCQFGEDTILVNVASQIDKLIREFMRLLRYFRSLHPERSYAGILDHAVVCGGLAGLPGFTDYLRGSLGLRVERARPLAGTVAQLRRGTFQSISERQEAFTVVMGLALAGLKGSMSRAGVTYAANEFAWSRSA